tara:strand:- start:153 stop:695 length:543 start_codon:yes stop_codon:yes gene_type:complete
VSVATEAGQKGNGATCVPAASAPETPQDPQQMIAQMLSEHLKAAGGGNGGKNSKQHTWFQVLMSVLATGFIGGGGTWAYTMLDRAEQISQAPEISERNTEAIEKLTEASEMQTEASARNMKAIEVLTRAVAGERDELTGRLVRPGLVQNVETLAGEVRSIRAHTVPGPVTPMTPVGGIVQ